MPLPLIVIHGNVIVAGDPKTVKCTLMTMAVTVTATFTTSPVAVTSRIPGALVMLVDSRI
jgi:hypothetical protein